MKIYDECHYCSECCIELTVQEDKFLDGLCEDCATSDKEISPEDAASLLAQVRLGPFTFEKLTQILTQR